MDAINISQSGGIECKAAYFDFWSPHSDTYAPAGTYYDNYVIPDSDPYLKRIIWGAGLTDQTPGIDVAGCKNCIVMMTSGYGNLDKIYGAVLYGLNQLEFANERDLEDNATYMSNYPPFTTRKLTGAGRSANQTIMLYIDDALNVRSLFTNEILMTNTAYVAYGLDHWPLTPDFSGPCPGTSIAIFG